MTRFRITLVVVVAVAIAAFFVLGLGQYLHLDYFKAQQAQLQSLVDGRPVISSAIFFTAYVAIAALSLPGGALMTMIAGALFGLIWGTLIVSFASSIGAAGAFLTARFVLRDWVQSRFGARLRAIDRGVEKDGAFYLFTLRLVPVFPFFVINLVMGLTAIRLTTFYIVSQIGMFAGTVVFVYAGTQIAAVNSVGDVLSPGLIVAFVLLGVFPLVARKTVERFQARKALRGFQKPRRFDRNIIVIGAGSAGLVAAYIAATIRASVTLIERDRMGGDCLNTGCVPSKTMIRSARLAALMRRGDEFGVHAEHVRVDFARVMARIGETIAHIAPHDSIERYQSLGVDVQTGQARITSPYTVEIDGRELTTRTIVIATGARPRIPPLPGLDQIDCLTSDNVWQLRDLPERLIVLGGGSIGCELGQAFARFGSRVIQIEHNPRLLMREDPDASAVLTGQLIADGVDVRTDCVARAVENRGGEKTLICEQHGRTDVIGFDHILIAVGRSPNLDGLGLETLGIDDDAADNLEVNAYLQTRFPNILACGDVAGPFRLTHAGAHQAWYAAINALFLGIRRFRADYSVIPRVTFTEPEIAHVGVTEREAQQQSLDFEVTQYELAELDRAICDGQTQGFVKVLTVAGKDRILGATIVGENAGELIGEYVTAMRHKLGMNKLLGTIHNYPTWIEANKYVAGEWKRRHAPERALRLLGRFHRWRRGQSRASAGRGD